MSNTFFPPIAVVGLSGVFPKATGRDDFWRNIVSKIDATAEVPQNRWVSPVEWVYNSSPNPDSAYSRNACLVENFEFDPTGFLLNPDILQGMDALHQWALHASRDAFESASISELDRRRIGVILAAIALPTDLSSEISRRAIGRHWAGPSPFPADPMAVLSSESTCGRVVSFPAAVVSHALGLGGVCYTLDAACASSLYAVKLACDELQSRRADAMLAGGVSRPDCLYTQIGFSQLKALSVSGRCAPFDRSADGLVVGEGAGVMVLKRLDDAVAQGDTIYGVIHGIGLSNDMRGNLLAPESAGQLRAMRMAYAQARWQPHEIDYIECHGAGTPVGDATELQSLRRLWGEGGWDKGQCSIGSIKSMIGHLLTGAGAAGMLKTLLAMHHKTLPPSLKFEHPPEGSPLIDSPFRVQSDVEPWPQKTIGKPRRAAISAFGFGGINAHVLIEEWPGISSDTTDNARIEIAERATKTPVPRQDVAIVGMDVTMGSIESIRDFQEAVFDGRSVLTSPPPGRWRAPEIIEMILPEGSPSDGGGVTNSIVGGFIDRISIEIGEFQIPPGELPDILPQQLLMLKKAAGAMRDAGLSLRETRDRMGVIVGIGFDYEATNFHLRWALPRLAKERIEASGVQIDEDELQQWLKVSRDECGPPLTATRTLGALGGIVASRIAREFRFGGPSFVVSAEEASGLRAVEIALRMLSANEVDAMLVGAVDLNCDERNMSTLFSRLGLSSRGQVRSFDRRADGTLPGEGAVALVFKRLDDAIQDQDRIYAVVEGVGSAGGSRGNGFRPDTTSYALSLERALKDAGTSASQIGMIETHGSGIPFQDRIETKALNDFFGGDSGDSPENPIIVGALKPIVGHIGAASGLASLAKTALSIFHQTMPPLANYETPIQAQWRRGLFHMPIKARYWVHNNTEGPRKACVAAMTSDGQCMHVVLRQTDGDKQPPDFDHTQTRLVGALPYGLFMIHGADTEQLLDGLNRLEQLVHGSEEIESITLERLARKWHAQIRDWSKGDHNLAILADCPEKLTAYLDIARQAVATGTSSRMNGRGGVCYFPDLSDIEGRVAFVYPGSGNHYVGMGRTLGVYWPQVLRDMNAATDRFKSQMLPQWYDPFRTDWSAGWQQKAYEKIVADPLRTIFGQVLFGGQMTGLLKGFGLRPDAVIGYSLGESAGLFAMGAWPDRGAMLERLETSDLFKTRLAGPCDAVRQAWRIPENQPVQWRVAAVNRSRQVVDEAIANLSFVRRLIVNTPTQCVIGGTQSQLETAIQKMKCEAIYLDGVVTVHCDAAEPAAQAYKELHRFPTHAVENVRFYSCAFERAYDLTSEAAAESITRQALAGFDFPRTIHQAYQDGVRIFVEIGPHCSCTRMIEQILADKPHLAVAANHRSEEEPLTLLKCLGTLAAMGLKIDMDAVFGYPEHRPEAVLSIMPGQQYKRESRTMAPAASGSMNQPGSNRHVIEVPVGGNLTGPTQELPLRPIGVPHNKGASSSPALDITSVATEPPPSIQPMSGPVPGLDFDTMIARLNENVTQTAKAHDQFLELSRQLTAQYGEAFNLQNRLLVSLKGDAVDPLYPSPEHPDAVISPPVTAASAADADVAFNREQCMQFAIGSVGSMLGPEFQIVDTFGARVRLPDEPLMLVDRIMRVEGKKLSLGPGRVITEHDVLPGAWYLDGDRAPVCISVEAGQADLFLCAYLGIDHQVKGQRTYRLLDARIRFHRGLPRPGETIQYDIHIDKFVKHEETFLFFFRFEGHIGKEHLITMIDGCAGFFTEAEVRNSGGIILTEEDKGPGASVAGIQYERLVSFENATYDDRQLEALRQGDAAACFGSQFQGLQLPPALRPPGGRMRLIHRIVSLQPQGGRFGRGYIRAEADIHPDDWFLTCHFVDDMVMPGTLMYECCAHALRVLLMRLGWVTDKPDVAYEPVQGVECRLKCRGPVTPQTRRVHYDVEIKEIGYHPEPYVIADAHMYADGHYIVFFKDMSMQMTGIAHEEILNFWNQRHADASGTGVTLETKTTGPLFTRDHILSFAVGKPSEAFGRPYEIFDQQRKIARLPGPPYCFMDRITVAEPQPWVLKPDGWVEAQYDVPADGWYFAADRGGVMPYCVLLEIALQPCGWLAAYAGSALRSANDLKFRNLGGKARIHANLRPAEKSLTMRTRMTKVSEAADMIIEHFDYQVLSKGRPVYTGNTYFGFFTAEALARQVGLRENAYAPDAQDVQSSVDVQLETEQPFTPEDVASGTRFQSRGLLMPAKALCMIDGIEAFNPEGGPHGLGFIRGYKIVDPQEWFFKAHFYQDPVCPGSLGVESFLQLIKYAALQRWGNLQASHGFEMLCDVDHQWSYRGQVIPANHKVVVDAVITRIEEGPAPVMMADGWLHADGISIYKMEGYGIKLVPLE